MEENELDSLTNKFNSICKEDTAVESPKIIHSSNSVSKVSLTKYQKIGIIMFGVYVLSFLVTYYIIDPKYYQEEEKTNKKQFLFCSVCIFLFLLIFFYSFRHVLKKYF